MDALDKSKKDDTSSIKVSITTSGTTAALSGEAMRVGGKAEKKKTNLTKDSPQAIIQAMRVFFFFFYFFLIFLFSFHLNFIKN